MPSAFSPLSRRIWLLGLAVLLASLSLSTDGQASAVRVSIGGTGSALAALRLLGTDFTALHPGIEVEVNPSLGTSGGLRAVAAGVLGLTVSARPLTEAERAAGLRAIPWGHTLVMVVVSPPVSDSSIDLAGLADILAGRREHWSNGTLITPVLRPPSDSDSLQLAATSPALAEALAAAHARPGMLVAITDQDASTAIADASGAIGTLTLLQTICETSQVKPLVLNGQRADLAALSAGTYPLRRDYWLVVGPHPSAEALVLLDYLIGPGAAKRLLTLGMKPASDR